MLKERYLGAAANDFYFDDFVFHPNPLPPSIFLLCARRRLTIYCVESASRPFLFGRESMQNRSAKYVLRWLMAPGGWVRNAVMVFGTLHPNQDLTTNARPISNHY